MNPKEERLVNQSFTCSIGVTFIIIFLMGILNFSFFIILIASYTALFLFVLIFYCFFKRRGDV